ncbi:MAG TPA: Na-translocating system protein MpsC family protein [Solirubrobacteraceae bacterium]
MAVSESGPAPNHGTADHGILSAISNEMVRIYKDQFGRGPTKTRTQWAGPDILVVTLEQTFTPAERKLRELREHERLRELRMLFQYSSVSVFCDPVEHLTGRKVRAFVSGIDTELDLASEMFVLYPAGSEGPSRASLPA